MSDASTMESNLVPAKLAAIAKDVYRVELSWHQRLITVYRPLYTPFDAVLRWIPPKADVLDVGCGTGALLLIADRLDKVSHGYGYDTHEQSLRVARAANRNPRIEFRCEREVPREIVGACNVLAVVDVLHHVPAEEKRPFLRWIASNATPGSLMIVKDVDPRPRWRALANRITDFLSTRSVVHYMAMSDVGELLSSSGFEIQEAKRLHKHVWSHYIVVGRKTA